MKKILASFVLLFSMSAFAELPGIIALVNDQPITKYDFTARKKMAIALNNIDNSDPNTDRQLNSDILRILVDEELLAQHAEKIGGTISKEAITDAIRSIEQRNKMPNGGMKSHLVAKGVDFSVFKKQIRGELIKNQIITSLSNSVSISPSEVDVAVIHSADKDFNVEAWVFTSKANDDKTLKQMQTLKNRFTSCNKVEEKLYNAFADGEKFDRKLKQMPSATRSIVLDTKVGSSSSIYKENNKFKMVFVCKKESTVSSNDLGRLKEFLSNKKMSKKAAKFFKDMKSKAYIKVMIPGYKG